MPKLGSNFDPWSLQMDIVEFDETGTNNFDKINASSREIDDLVEVH